VCVCVCVCVMRYFVSFVPCGVNTLSAKVTAAAAAKLAISRVKLWRTTL